MFGSSHIHSVLISVEYRICHQTLDFYFLFATWMGQIQSKLIYILVTYGQASLLQDCNFILIKFAQVE